MSSSPAPKGCNADVDHRASFVGDMRMDQDAGIDQHHWESSPSMMASASGTLSTVVTRTRPSRSSGLHPLTPSLAPIEQVVDPNRHYVDATIPGVDDVAGQWSGRHRKALVI